MTAKLSGKRLEKRLLKIKIENERFSGYSAKELWKNPTSRNRLLAIRRNRATANDTKE